MRPCRAPAVLAVVAVLAFEAAAQPAVDTPAALTGERAAERSVAVRDDIAVAFDCQIELLGSPRHDAFLGEWLTAYSAAGPGCDDAQPVLVEQGRAVGVQFLRRPTAAQLRNLLVPMMRAAELASGCRVGLRGQPVFDAETVQWYVGVATNGAGCDSAVADLARQARALDVVVLTGGSRTLQVP